MNEAAADSEKVKRPPILGFFKSVVITLTYLRRNRVQAELGDSFGVSQPTVSRAITALTPLLGKVLRTYVPTADELDGNTQYLVDGTLLPCWSWASHPELHSGKHNTTGMNAQVACTLDGDLAWISDPIEGSHHDTYRLSESGVLLTLDPSNWVGDRGYPGNKMITPIKKPTHRDPLDWEKKFNTQNQQDPMDHRASHRPPQDLANPGHRLPAADRNLSHHNLNRHSAPFLEML